MERGPWLCLANTCSAGPGLDAHSIPRRFLDRFAAVLGAWFMGSSDPRLLIEMEYRRIIRNDVSGGGGGLGGVAVDSCRARRGSYWSYWREDLGEVSESLCCAIDVRWTRAMVSLCWFGSAAEATKWRGGPWRGVTGRRCG